MNIFEQIGDGASGLVALVFGGMALLIGVAVVWRLLEMLFNAIFE